MGGTIRSEVKQHGRKLTRAEQNAMTNVRQLPKLMFSDFQKVILDFQLEEHEKFLNKFTALFSEVDINKTGVLNEE